MLQELLIRNFAIIEDLHLRLGSGLTVFSGETGAGKSIIINAVNLLLGSRASAKLIRAGAKSAELQALFRVMPESPVADLLQAEGHDPGEGLIVRRIISRGDHNRIYLNGVLATVANLAALTARLASISGQHAHQGLLKEDEHLIILDRFAGLLPERRAVSETYHRLAPLIERQRRLQRLKGQQAERIELLQFQQREIEAAAIVPGEDAALEQERRRLKHGEMLYGTVHGAIEALYDQDGAVVEALATVHKNLSRAADVDTDLAAPARRLEELELSLADLCNELRGYLGRLDIDPRRLETVEERLDALLKLKRKYGGDLDAVLLRSGQIASEIAGIENLDVELEQIEAEMQRLALELGDRCQGLTARRREAAQRLSAKVETELEVLKMAGTRFQVALAPIAATDRHPDVLQNDGRAFTETGGDQAEFQIAPNVGEGLKPLAAIASGGELSRIVLALKAILAETDALQTVVFDEVDAGIGGAVAEVVGRKLAQLARHHQLICITHLPQIAKFGDHHFRIRKEVLRGRTQTYIEKLDAEARLQELARMLGGEEITPRTVAHARELLERR